jgi:hypothetical protein
MTLRFYTPKKIVTTFDAFFKIKEFMKSSSPVGPGWTIKRSGDGVSVVGDGDVLNSISDFHVNCWFILKDPAGNRELLFVLYSDGVIIYYSKLGLFEGGTATVKPSASDEKIVFARYDSPNILYIKCFINPSMLYIWADNSNEYAFGFIGYSLNSGLRAGGGFTMDEVIGGLPDDFDNIIFYGSDDNGVDWESSDYTNPGGDRSEIPTGCCGYIRDYTRGDKFSIINAFGFKTKIGITNIFNTITSKVGFNKTYDNKQILYPIILCNSALYNGGYYYSANSGFKGVSKYIKFNSIYCIKFNFW